MSCHELASDPAIAAMTDTEFAEYWQALGTVIRIRARHTQPTTAVKLVRDPASTIAATTSLAPRRTTPTGFRTP